jgi:hypothetical protein
VFAARIGDRHAQHVARALGIEIALLLAALTYVPVARR